MNIQNKNIEYIIIFYENIISTKFIIHIMSDSEGKNIMSNFCNFIYVEMIVSSQIVMLEIFVYFYLSILCDREPQIL